VDELADADLRALQVGEHADALPYPVGNLAHARNDGGVLLGGAVREIHAHDVDAGAQHALEDLGRGRRRAERGHDLRGAGNGLEHGRNRENAAVNGSTGRDARTRRRMFILTQWRPKYGTASSRDVAPAAASGSG